ncbi:hypothetical protein BY996DRAFT_3201186 [Phakopsora pachyrhizi]|nr:hypothetical protein BY996DRAFT_3201186 [Phakopsora pachyrhizi]
MSNNNLQPKNQINNGDQLDQSNSIVILLIRPTGMESDPSDETVRVHYFSSKVIQLKSLISNNWDGKPRVDGIRLIAKGRILNDEEFIGPALSNQPGDAPTHPVHVVIRPNAWTDHLSLRSTPQRPVSAPPLRTTPTTNTSTTTTTTATAINHLSPLSTLSSTIDPTINNSIPSPHSLPSTAAQTFNSSTLLFNLPNQSNPNSAPIPGLHSSQLLWSHFSNLNREQRTCFIENLTKAQFCLIERLDVLRSRIYSQQLRLNGFQSFAHQDLVSADQSSLIEEQDLAWIPVDRSLTQLLNDLQYWGNFQDSVESKDNLNQRDLSPDPISEYMRVEISGLPFLLHIPKSFRDHSRRADLNKSSGLAHDLQNSKKQLERAMHLEKRLHLLITQTKRIEACNHLDFLLSMTPNSLFNSGMTPLNRPPNVANVPATRVNLGQEYQNYLRQNQNIFNGTFQPQPHGNPNPNAIPPPQAGVGPALGFGVGIGNGGMFPFQHNMMMPNPPAWAHPIPRVRRYEFTINLDSIRRYMAPLFWLSIKLSFLLYIFGRHASFNKRAILVCMAIGWVLWEAFAISQRHEAQNRRRERVQRFQQAGGQAGGAAGAGAIDPVQAVLDRGRRRAERERLQQRLRDQRQQLETGTNQQNNQAASADTNSINNPTHPNPPPAPRPAAPLPPVDRPPAEALALNPPPTAQPPRRAGRQDLRAAAADIRARGGAFPPGTEVRPFRATSAFSPKYWFNSIAVVGLASEYRELGLHPIGELAMGSSNSEYPRWYKYARNFKTCLVLFIGTLLPEIEKKRKKALEKRSRILNLVLADAAREREAVTNEAQSTTSVTGREDSRRDNQNQASSSESSSAAVQNVTSEVEDRLATPKAVALTSLELSPNASQQNLIHRTPRASGSMDSEGGNDSLINRVATPPRASPEKPMILANGLQISESSSATTTGQSFGVPSTLTPQGSSSQIPVIPKDGEPSSDEAIISGTSGMSHTTVMANTGTRQSDSTSSSESLDSPLTPLNERQVVGGLDDTDDEEIGGVEDEEAGMMLF